ncbi:hypothetical protein JMJ77_0008315 [Colletotrichum scovillei]|uniref:Uncharacterized protein n=1 Tax=Colletotrichum scovillei TaxID=1209932 RepID=A0A9P7RHX4_9PEZI|nr:hypothetical protein JMJ77_0008315 [Colletotrichum scovillei]KAG7075345.1 hypothetical protein JMJ76_0011805 [Colletotrichum scovillei]KAG7082328.1 hypothetical protein JMJ78_0004431 [Colletotrichum scovillei]
MTTRRCGTWMWTISNLQHLQCVLNDGHEVSRQMDITTLERFAYVSGKKCKRLYCMDHYLVRTRDGTIEKPEQHSYFDRAEVS